MDSEKVVLTVSVTGSIGDRSSNPALPVTPKEIAKSAVDAGKAGAAVAHIHVRDVQTGKPSMDFGPHVFINYLPHVEWMAERIRDAGVKPELEVFDMGHIEKAKHLIRTGRIKSPPLFQLCTGIRWGIPATPESMIAMKGLLPHDAAWTGFGIGATAFPMVALASVLGGNVRIGFEDCLYIEKGKPASSNRQLVEKAVDILRLLGRVPARPAEARKLLNLEG
ncbi:MAG: 3-keto-5-aminohexanoate cleavage protein [Proteobacteria bacterium]|nr:3-keto-5-aminohexanoate cleavage protein [Pseudomonadota bacterium]